MTEVVHIINSLSLGGAERMLLKLAEESAREGKRLRVYTILSGGVLRENLAQVADVEQLGLRSLLKAASAEVVICWMYHSCLIGVMLKALNPRLKLVWNIRHSLHALGHEKPLTRFVIRLLALVRFKANAVMFNSRLALEQHFFLYSRDEQAIVIPNGFELDRYHFSPAARDKWRADWPSLPAIGLVARFHPMKGHAVLLQAARDLGAHLVFAGEGTQTPEFRRFVDQHYQGSWVGLGAVDDIPGLMSGLDILTVPSTWGEGFPNVIGEAMLSGTLVVASDIGDSRFVLSEPAAIVPAGDVAALRETLKKTLLLSEPERAARLSRARSRVEENFSLQAVYLQFLRLARTVCAE